jgi:hypothetical protein
MKKLKLLALLLVAALFAAMLFACGEDSVDTPATTATAANEEAAVNEPTADEPAANEPAAGEAVAEEPATTDEPAAEEPPAVLEFDYLAFDLDMPNQWNLLVAQLLPITAGNTYEVGIRYRGTEGLRICFWNTIHEDGGDDFVFINLDAADDWVEASGSVTTVYTHNYAVYVLNHESAFGDFHIDRIWLYDTANPGVNLLVNGDFTNNSNHVNNNGDDIFGVVAIGETGLWHVLHWHLR